MATPSNWDAKEIVKVMIKPTLAPAIEAPVFF
jgi:hypothetical protein